MLNMILFQTNTAGMCVYFVHASKQKHFACPVAKLKPDFLFPFFVCSMHFSYCFEHACRYRLELSLSRVRLVAWSKLSITEGDKILGSRKKWGKTATTVLWMVIFHQLQIRLHPTDELWHTLCILRYDVLDSLWISFFLLLFWRKLGVKKQTNKESPHTVCN